MTLLTLFQRLFGYDPLHVNLKLKYNVKVEVKRGGTDKWITVDNVHNLITNAGRDWIFAQVLTNTSAGTRGAGFVALSNDTGAADATHTTLAGELSTNGLGRADADTKTHTTGTTTGVIQNTFTATGSQTAIQKTALFNAASTGTMLCEATMTSVDVANTDTLRVTWTHTYS